MTQLPPEIDCFLSRFEARRRRQHAVRAVGRAVLFTGVWMGAWCLLDRWFDLPGLVRAVGLIANISCVGAMIARPLMALWGRVDPPRVALEVERREARFGEKLATVASRVPGPEAHRGSGELLEALSRHVIEDLRTTNSAALLPWRRALRPWAGFVVVAALAVLMMRSSWLDAPRLARRFVMPLAEIEPVTTTRLTVLPGDVSIPRDEALRVRARARRLSADAPPPMLHIRSAGGAWAAFMMTSAPDGWFETRISPVSGDLEYYVTAGDATSDRARVTALESPSVSAFYIAYAYPPYTGLPPREVTNSDGQIEAPAGTRVMLTIETTEPLRLASMTIGAEAVRMSPTTRPDRWLARFTVVRDAPYVIRMAAASGASSAFRGGTIRVIPDRPPVVVLTGTDMVASGAENSRAPTMDMPVDAVVPVGYQAADDYPLTRLDAEVTVTHVGGGETRKIYPLQPRGARQLSGDWMLNPRAVGAVVGDVVELRFRAEDQSGQLDLSTARRWRIGPAINATPPPPASPTATSSTHPASAEPPLPMDPAGYEPALRAYFDALRSRDR